MSFITYAQNGEDVVLSRAFPRGYIGFYVDIGASDPVVDSVTKHFYDRGWDGVNVEPSPSSVDDLREARPRDTTVHVGVGAARGSLPFFELERRMRGSSTFSAKDAESYRVAGLVVAKTEVEVVTLAALLDTHAAGRTVDFLKIDVEGQEAEVLASADWTAHRPRILVVEATAPGTPRPTSDEWESLVLASGYSFCLFDGLNRFYVREEDLELKPMLQSPANVFDDFVPARFWRLERELAAERQNANRISEQLVQAGRDVNALQAALDNALHGVAIAATAREEALAEALQATRVELKGARAALRDSTTELVSARAAVLGLA